LPVRLGLGAAIGTGKQNFPWIHNDDICGIYMKALDDATMQGAYNAVAPEFISNKYLMKTMAHVLHKPFWLPDIPPLLIKLLYGELSVSLLNGSKISSEKIKSAGYKFKYETLASALADLLNK
jgi:NAD dependent epimerase/dehydratase family enzyme